MAVTYTLAVVYIVKNSARHMAASLPTIYQVADEIIVLDSGSTDDTEKICAQYGAKFHCNTDWQGFGIQRQRAQALVNSDWILMLDADEAADEALQDAILQIKQQPPCAATVYGIRRLDYLFGELIDSPHWLVPIKAHKRLYAAAYYRFCASPVHESLQSAAAEVIPLHGYLLHNTAESPDLWLQKRLDYAHTWALDRHSKGKVASVITICLHTIAAFFKQYFIDGRFLCGKIGLIYALLFSNYTFNKYAMLYDLRHVAKRRAQDCDE